MSNWALLLIAFMAFLIVILLICLIYSLVLMKKVSGTVKGGIEAVGHLGGKLIRQWKKADELNVMLTTHSIRMEPRLEVMKTDIIIQGEYNGKMPWLKFFSKKVRAYMFYPLEVRYYIPLKEHLRFNSIDTDTYGGLENIVLQVSDVEYEFHEPGLTKSKLFLDIDSGNISGDQRQEILKICWRGIEKEMKELKIVPPTIEQNLPFAREAAALTVQKLLRDYGITQPVGIEFLDRHTKKVINTPFKQISKGDSSYTFLLEESDVTEI